jgi:hypothetical protein
MIGRLLCAFGLHMPPRKGRRWLWFCGRPGCRYVHPAERRLVDGWHDGEVTTRALVERFRRTRVVRVLRAAVSWMASE